MDVSSSRLASFSVAQGPARPDIPASTVHIGSRRTIVRPPSRLHWRSDDDGKQSVCRVWNVEARGEVTGLIMFSGAWRDSGVAPSGGFDVSLRCATPDFHTHLRRSIERSRVAPTRKA